MQPRNRRTFTKDVDRDAALVEAAMRGCLEPLVIGLGWTPAEVFVYHPHWLAQQPQEYRDQVVEAVIAIQDKRMSESQEGVRD